MIQTNISLKLLRNGPNNVKFYSKSNIKEKLEFFIQKGKIRKTEKEINNKLKKKFEKIKKVVRQNIYSPQKMLLLLKARYEDVFDKTDINSVSLSKIKPSDLRPERQTSIQIFNQIVSASNISKRPIDKRLALSLLGVSKEQSEDSFFITKKVCKLLENDNSWERSMYLMKFCDRKQCVVAFNHILKWTLSKGKIKDAFKILSDCRKWGIKNNTQTYIILFDGISKAIEWGKADDKLCEKCENILIKLKDTNYIKNEKNESILNINHFNSCLSVLVKNFSSNQKYAWSFFNLLIPDADEKEKILHLKSNCQTFTIFLNGIKNYFKSESERVIKDQTKNDDFKTLELLDLHSSLVNYAHLIYKKVFKLSTPPIPPSKESSINDSSLLINYKNQINGFNFSIDSNFISTFISCFENTSFRTSSSLKQGSHYKYNETSLIYLKEFCEPIKEIYNFLSVTLNSKSVFLSNKNLKIFTDKRINRALMSIDKFNFQNDREPLKLENLLPEKVIENFNLNPTDINPLVLFPPPILSKNKKKALLNEKKKKLIDFSRNSFIELEKIKQNDLYVSSKGKIGVKLNSEILANLKKKKKAINIYLIMNFTNCLINLEKYDEFYLSIFYILKEWGGISLDFNELLKNYKPLNFFSGILTDFYFPKPIISNEEKKILINTDKVDSNIKFHDPKVIDILLIENFFYKIHEQINFQGKTSNNIIVEIFSVLINPEINRSKSLYPSDKTVNIIFSCLITSINYYYDYNNLNFKFKTKDLNKNLVRFSLTHEQLKSILGTLIKFINSLIIFESKKNNERFYISEKNLISYNKLVKKLYDSNWCDSDTNKDLIIHKLIIKSGILIYKPTILSSESKNNQPFYIKSSINNIYNHLKNRKDISDNDSALISQLEMLLNIKKNKSHDNEDLSLIKKKIYQSYFVNFSI